MLLSEGRDFLHGQVVFVSFPEQLFRRVPVAVDEAHDVQGRTVHASPVRRFINRETASVHAEPFAGFMPANKGGWVGKRHDIIKAFT